MHHTAKYTYMWRRGREGGREGRVGGEGGKGEVLQRLLASSMRWSCASSLYTCIPRGWLSDYTTISEQRGHRPAPSDNSKATPYNKNKA